MVLALPPRRVRYAVAEGGAVEHDPALLPVHCTSGPVCACGPKRVGEPSVSGAETMSEFGVHGLDRMNERGAVIGRCHRGVIRVGDTFATAITPGAAPVQVKLQVARIEAYERDLAEVDEGLTARLYLHGEGWAALGPGAVLSTSESSPTSPPETA